MPRFVYFYLKEVEVISFILVVTESVSLLERSLTITTGLVYVLVKVTVCHSSVKDKDPYSACNPSEGFNVGAVVSIVKDNSEEDSEILDETSVAFAVIEWFLHLMQ